MRQKASTKVVFLLVLGLLLQVATTAEGLTQSLQELGAKLEPLPEATIYSAKKIITMNPKQPAVEAVAVVGGRILAVGSKAMLVKAMQYT